MSAEPCLAHTNPCWLEGLEDSRATGTGGRFHRGGQGLTVFTSFPISEQLQQVHTSRWLNPFHPFPTARLVCLQPRCLQPSADPDLATELYQCFCCWELAGYSFRSECVEKGLLTPSPPPALQRALAGERCAARMNGCRLMGRLGGVGRWHLSIQQAIPVYIPPEEQQEVIVNTTKCWNEIRGDGQCPAQV